MKTNNTRGIVSMVLAAFVGGIVGFFQNPIAAPTTLEQARAVAFGMTIAGGAAVFGWFKEPPNQALVVARAEALLSHFEELAEVRVKAHLVTHAPAAIAAALPPVVVSEPAPVVIPPIDPVMVEVLAKLHEMSAKIDAATAPLPDTAPAGPVAAADAPAEDAPKG